MSMRFLYKANMLKMHTQVVSICV